MAGQSKLLENVYQWMKARPFKSTAIGMFLGMCLASPMVDLFLKEKAAKELKRPVYEKLVRGSRPKIPAIYKGAKYQRISRPDVAGQIQSLFFPEPVDQKTRFGVIIGPSGSGKTFAVTSLCNELPEGVLYFEIAEPAVFAKDLGEEAGMKTAPTNMWDLILGYVSDRYLHYYNLKSECQLIGLDVVFKVLRDAAVEYQKNYGKVPVFFIDGVDLLAKYNEEVCRHLISHSKLLANKDFMRIVLVSSEGTIVPLMKSLSAVNRAVMFEVGDISDEQSIRFLMERGFSEQLSRDLVYYVGGRLVHLESCVFLLDTYNWNGEKMYEVIKEVLFQRDVSNQAEVVGCNKGTCLKIFRELSIGQPLPTNVLVDNIAVSNDKKAIIDVKEVIGQLVSANILRYNIKGYITWHSKIQYREFIEGTTNFSKP